MKYKLKTKSSAKKRFGFTKSGKIKRNKAYGSHILTKKTRERKRNYKKAGIVKTANVKQVKRMMPYVQ